MTKGSKEREKVKKTHNTSVSFQIGLSVAFIVFVFFFTESESGINLIFTYGSLRPLGSIGMRLRLNEMKDVMEREKKKEKKMYKTFN